MNKETSKLLASFDHLVNPAAQDSALAISVVEQLKPLDSHTAIFPPTYAVVRGKCPYALNELATPDRNRVALDSVGAQANRMREIFLKDLASVLPQITISTESGEIPLAKASHRLADGVVTVSTLGEKAKEAFQSYLKGNPLPLVALDPLSLVFGVWDSRGTLARAGRIVTSTIDAWDVSLLSRSAQFTPTVDYSETDLHKETTTGQVDDEKNPLAQLGFLPVPSVDKPGGVEVNGDILRLTSIDLVAIQNLEVPEDEEKTLKLRRYILGLSLAAAFSQAHYFLRAGCQLKRKARTATIESMESEKPFVVDWSEIQSFVEAAARDFGITGEKREFRLEKDQVEKLIRAKAKAAGEERAKKTGKKLHVAKN